MCLLLKEKSMINDKLNQIRIISYKLHKYLGCGFLEKVYENALVHRLQLAGFSVERQAPIIVRDETGCKVGLLINFGASSFQIKSFKF